MKKRITSVMCAAMAAALVTVGCMGAETVEAAQNDNSAIEEDEFYFEGPYAVSGPDGQEGLVAYVENNGDDDIYVGMTVEWLDESNVNIGTSTAFIPCLGPDECSLIYVVNYYDETVTYQANAISYGETKLASASDALYAYLNCEEKGDYVRFTTVNPSNDYIDLPMVTVLYMLDDDFVGIYSGILAEAPGSMDLAPGSGAYVNIGCPDEYDDFMYCVTAYYDHS